MPHPDEKNGDSRVDSEPEISETRKVLLAEGETPAGEDEDEDEYERQYRQDMARTILIRRVVHGNTDAMLNVEKKSVFGAGVLIPQLARCSGWSRGLIEVTIKIYLYVLFGFFVQIELLRFIDKEELVLDLFSGQSFLCDFGAPFENCPDDPTCAGPAGTKITPDRMYSYATYSNRRFMKTALLDLFPDKKDEIEDKVDPGEYGAESKWCRWLCCFLFMMGVMSELQSIYHLGKLLYVIPTEAGEWISIDEAGVAAASTTTPRGSVDSRAGFSGQKGRRTVRFEEDNALVVKIAGMPLLWKMVNVIFILFPKAVVWRLTASAGVTFLMETAEINDVIINAVALAFILQIDEMIFEALMPGELRELTLSCKGYARHVVDRTEEPSFLSFKTVFLLVPSYGIATLALTAYFVYYDYYMAHCDWQASGFFTSKAMYMPSGSDFSFLQTLTSTWLKSTVFLKHEGEPFWTFDDKFEPS